MAIRIFSGGFWTNGSSRYNILSILFPQFVSIRLILSPSCCKVALEKKRKRNTGVPGARPGRGLGLSVITEVGHVGGRYPNPIINAETNFRKLQETCRSAPPPPPLLSGYFRAFFFQAPFFMPEKCSPPPPTHTHADALVWYTLT